MSTTVLGVDGAPGGWVYVALDEAAPPRLGFVPRISDLPEAEVIGIDMPLGFPLPGTRRPAEVAARSRLGRRASTVFSVPPRAVLESPDYATAREMAVRTTGRSISAQSYALRAKILEAVDEERAGLPLIEVHPEVAFVALAGRALPGKKTWDGHAARRMVLANAGIDLTGATGTGEGAQPDDVLDAGACAWVAARRLRDEAMVLDWPAHAEDRPIWV